MIALIVIGVLVLGLAGFVFWFLKIRDPLKGEDFYKFHAEQKWAWELTLTPEQEKAFMAGLEAYDDERGCYPMREEGILRVYGPMMLISLFWMTERFAAMGPAAVQDPAGAVQQLMTDAADGETDGILYYDDEWMGEGVEQVDGMDKYAFTDAIMSATHAQGVDHEFAGGYADEDKGFVTMGVLAKSPEHVAQMYEDAYAVSGPQAELNNRLDVMREVMKPENPEYVAAHDRAEAEKSKYINTLIFCFDRVVKHYNDARPEMQYAEPRDVLSVVMAQMLEDGRSGYTWTRPPTQEQHELALAILGNRG
ncbi:hypothetical protein EV649_3100 [Kribbella sp. VKM Ac-2569]|uniref:hypothetical protein n=1 Tax=Kribbella sp. VKM Ac-2569 TaxID=2512220 RepID=UPI00102CC928|nr:hypothetical protein [Kribbella sp. VKM Ac-2569]RZT19960.1 hypothetical protein EV649_3100 [Kribbella sp. VKM Ac-2569]